MGAVQAVVAPRDGLIDGCLERVDYADAYRVAIPAGVTGGPEALAARVFARSPGWVSFLMRLRNWIVGPLGLKTTAAAGERVGFFRVYARSGREILLGENDKHLDFRVSVRVSGEAGPRVAVVTTLVRFHNWVGQLYFLVVRPFHRVIVPAVIRHALR